MAMKSIYNFRYGSYLEIEDKIWFFNQNFNGLVSVGKCDGKIINIYRDPRTVIQGRFLYSSIAYYEHNIILIPLVCSSIAIFDMNKEEFSYIELDRALFTDGNVRFIGYCQVGKYIYMFPGNMSALVKLNSETMEIQYINKGIEKQIRNSAGCVFRNQFEIVDNKIYMPFLSSSGIAVYDMETDCFEVKLEKQLRNCSTISYKDGLFYIGSWNEKRLYIWDENSGLTKKVDIDIALDSEYTFNASHIDNDKLFLVPYHADEMVLYDIKKGTYALYHYDVDLKELNTSYLVKKDNGTMCLAGTNTIWEISMSNEDMQLIPYVEMDEEYNRHTIARYFLDSKMFSNIIEKERKLEDLIDVIMYA